MDWAGNKQEELYMKLKTDKFYGEQEMIVCPLCGEGFTHLVGVEVFSRREDDEKGLHVLVKNCDSTSADVHVDTDISKNTSSRRGSVHLHIECEICQETAVVCLDQHKGATLVNISVSGEANE